MAEYTGIEKDVRIIIQRQSEYIYIPDLKPTL